MASKKTPRKPPPPATWLHEAASSWQYLVRLVRWSTSLVQPTRQSVVSLRRSVEGVDLLSRCSSFMRLGPSPREQQELKARYQRTRRFERFLEWTRVRTRLTVPSACRQTPFFTLQYCEAISRPSGSFSHRRVHSSPSTWMSLTWRPRGCVGSSTGAIPWGTFRSSVHGSATLCCRRLPCIALCYKCWWPSKECTAARARSPSTRINSAHGHPCGTSK